MITCPNCQNQELPGALVCSRCGGLFDLSQLSGSQLEEPLEAAANAFVSQDRPQPGSLQISLLVLGTDTVLRLPPRPQVTVGRADVGLTSLPDIDLTPFMAYQKGVSRLHISIKIASGKASIVDLGSSNGTMLNSKRILPNQAYLINTGDRLSLGKLELQVILQSPGRKA
jgi:hypothetical protein